MNEYKNKKMKEVRNDKRKEFEKRKITRKVYCKDIIR